MPARQSATKIQGFWPDAHGKLTQARVLDHRAGIRAQNVRPRIRAQPKETSYHGLNHFGVGPRPTAPQEAQMPIRKVALGEQATMRWRQAIVQEWRHD